MSFMVLMAYQPFMFEPERLDSDSGSELQISSSSDDELEGNFRRLGNTDWCSCDRCRAFDTVKESVCCREIGNINCKMENLQCIIQHYDFPILCLYPEVLRTALVARADVRRDDFTEPIPNRTLRYQAYRQFTYWVHNRLGRYVRRVIPSCAVWRIRDEFPAPDGSYVGFTEADV